MAVPGHLCRPAQVFYGVHNQDLKSYHLDFLLKLVKIALMELYKLRLDYTRRARWPFRAFCVDGLHQITQYWCNYIKLIEIGNRTVTMSTFSWVLLENSKVSSFYSPQVRSRSVTHTGRTHRRTDTRTNKHQILGTLYTKGPKGQKIEDRFNTTFIRIFRILKPIARHKFTCTVSKEQSVYFILSIKNR